MRARVLVASINVAPLFKVLISNDIISLEDIIFSVSRAYRMATKQLDSLVSTIKAVSSSFRPFVLVPLVWQSLSLLESFVRAHVQRVRVSFLFGFYHNRCFNY